MSREPEIRTSTNATCVGSEYETWYRKKTEESPLAATNENLDTRRTDDPPLARRHSPEEVAAMIARRGYKPLSTYDDLLGAGRELWESDADLEQFVNGIEVRRRERE